MTDEKPNDPIRDALVAHKREIASLAGGHLATHALVAHLCRALIGHDPALREPIEKAFDGATNFLELLAAKDKSAMPEHTANAVRIIDQLWDTAMGESKPRRET